MKSIREKIVEMDGQLQQLKKQEINKHKEISGERESQQNQHLKQKEV